MVGSGTEEPPVDQPYPATRRDDVVDTLHGVEVAGPYRWLEDVTSPEVQAWMAAQQAFTRRQLDALPDRDALRARLTALFYYDALGVPRHHGGRYFWARKHADREKSVVYWKDGADGDARVLFDPETWSDDGSVGLGGWWPSWDGRRVVYAVKANNADEAVLHVVDVATGEVTGDVIEGAKYADPAWTPDNQGFYYVWIPPVGGDVTVQNRPGFAELRFHALGADPAADPVVHPRTGDPATFLGGQLSKDGRWLIATIQHGWTSNDVYFQDLRAATPGWQPLVVGVDAQFSVLPWQDRFYIQTNHEAPRHQLLVADPARPARAGWRPLVAEDATATIDGFAIVGGRLVVTYMRQASSRLEIRELDGTPVREVALPGVGTTAGIHGEPDEDTGYFAFTSFTEPSIIFETSLATGATTEWSRVTLPLDTTPFVTEQVTYASKDGTAVTMFLLHHRDVVPDGTNPTILYGYGGFQVSLTPAFASSRMVWLERGGVYAIPNLRGGGEYGEAWHRDGMRDAKQNVFDDFVAAARWLVDHGWTTPARLAIHGGSNGGLLVGAAMTQAPELFGAVVCAVPLLDMIRYHRFGSGETWTPEYGSAEDPAQFATLRAYSPYHHVVAGTAYPALLMLSADSDDRVDPMHARKFAAAIQWASSSGRPALLRIEANAGHGGADLVKQAVDQYTDIYAFLAARLAPSTT
ncbi:MAG: S9 family peptidase [Myxococcales bacterium]|nr:S9 family peptidase [Myxococcales bacterium]